jgi:ribosome-binding factor A
MSLRLGVSNMSKQLRSPEGDPTGHRHERLTRILHEELGALVRDELHDPALDGVTITLVELSVDYKHARVGFIASTDRREAATRALSRATPFVRAQLADAVDLKAVPALRFVWDAYATTAPDDAG